MGSILHTITSLSAAKYGVNVLEVAPPASVKSASSNVIGMIADLPWGPTNTVTLITNLAEFFATFYPDVFSASSKDTATYPALRALLRKRLPGGGLKVVRIAATSAAKATSGSITAGGGSITINAKYAGDLGEQISYQIVAATSAESTERNLVVTIGSSYSATYENLTYDALILVDDPYIDIVDSSSDAVPAVMGSASALASGSNGTAVAADYVGSSGSNVGIRQFYGASIDVNVIFVAECPAALVATVNAGLTAWGTDTDKGIAVLSTPSGQASSDTLTYVADNSLSDDRSFYTWPQVKARDLFLSDQAVTVMDGNAFAAFAIANIDPWLSPGGGGKVQGGVDLLAGIVGLEDESATLTTLNLLDDVGVTPWYVERTLGVILHRAITTDGSTRLFSRRAKDWIQQTLAQYAVGFAETQLDLTLSSQDLGPNTGGLISGWTTWLENQKTRKRIQSYSIDAFSANTQTNIDAGQWIVVVRVKLYAMIEELVLKAEIGETVQIADA